MSDNQNSQPFLPWVRRVVTLPRSTKRLVMLLADGLALPASAVIAVWLVRPEILASLPKWIWLIPLVGRRHRLGPRRFLPLGRPLHGVRARSSRLSRRSRSSRSCSGSASAGSTRWPDAFRASAAFWLLGMVYVVGSRLTVAGCCRARNAAGDRVVIYGAGDAGAHLVSALARARRFRAGRVRRRQRAAARRRHQRARGSCAAEPCRASSRSSA